MAALLKFLSGDIQADGSAERRLDLLFIAFRYWSDTWWSVFFGDGLFSFSQQLHGFYLLGAQPHNLVAAILAEFGLVGLVIFALLLMSLLVPGTMHIDKRSAVAAVLLALAVGAALRTLASGDMANTVELLVYLGLLSSLRQRAVQGPPLRVSAGQGGPPAAGSDEAGRLRSATGKHAERGSHTGPINSPGRPSSRTRQAPILV